MSDLHDSNCQHGTQPCNCKPVTLTDIIKTKKKLQKNQILSKQKRKLSFFLSVSLRLILLLCVKTYTLLSDSGITPTRLRC